MNIADRTKICREKLGLSQGKVAKLLGISQPSYQRLERGDVQNPKQLDKLAEIYKATPQWIKFGVGEPPAYLKGSMMAEGHVPQFNDWNLIKIWRERKYNIETVFNDTAARAGAFAVGEPLRGKGITFIPIPEKRNPKQFALKIQNDSMISTTAGTRSFLLDDTIVIDPELDYKDGNYVIALTGKEMKPVFAQYVSYGGEEFLKPLNTQYPTIKISKDVTICGVATTHMKSLV